MSAINTHDEYSFITNTHHFRKSGEDKGPVSVSYGSSYADNADVPVTTMLGFLLAMVAGVVLILTDQPPWFLITPVVALVIMAFLPKGVDVSLQQ